MSDYRAMFPNAHFSPGEFVRAKANRKTNLGKKLYHQFLLFYCSREQIRLVENGFKNQSTVPVVFIKNVCHLHAVCLTKPACLAHLLLKKLPMRNREYLLIWLHVE
jgi:hypothetical protein